MKKGILLGLIVGALALNAQAAKPKLMAAMGDSITAGANANVPGPNKRNKIDNKTTLSWSAGNKINSHFMILKEKLQANGESLEVMNAAVSGSKTGDLTAQAKKIVSAANSGKYDSLAYVTVLIGANDICHSNSEDSIPLDSMYKNLYAALSTLNSIKQQEPVRVLVSDLPRIPDLGTEEMQNATVLGVPCGVVHSQAFGRCKVMTSWKGEEGHMSKLAVLEEVNSSLEAAVLEGQKKFKNLKLEFVRSLTKLPLKPNFMAGDCFHPSTKGQTQISEQLWADQTLF